jgi:copper chaperone
MRPCDESERDFVCTAGRDQDVGAARRDCRGEALQTIPRWGILALAMKEDALNETTYSVPGIHCAHCEAALTRELEAVEGVESVAVDLDGKHVTVTGQGLDDAALRAAIDEAGYEVAA